MESKTAVSLKELEQWIVWRLEERSGKPTKVPYSPVTDGRASCSDSSTWSSWAEAKARLKAFDYEGLGFVFSSDDPFCGIDLDKCVDPETGEIEPWASAIVDELSSYTELSPSGTGLHIIVRAELPPGRRRKGSVEVYDRGRFFTVTGERIGERNVEERQNALEALHVRLFPPAPKAEKPRREADEHELSDEEIVRLGSGAANGAKFTSLWFGDLSAFDSASEADLALVNMLVFWTGPDPDRIDALFRQSGLMREKWERADYRRRTIETALADATEFYSPARHERDDEAPDSEESSEAVVTPRPTPAPAWPALDEAAYYGLAGEIVKAIEPHTEADPVAVLINLLSAFGNAIGQGAFFKVGASKHHLKINAVLVGETAKGRKGMSWDYVDLLMHGADSFWSESRVENGLSSGEGLIYAVRDRVVGEDKDGDPITIDSGAEDKRLMVMEGEFAGVLKVCTREGNTLSAIIRAAWDRGKLGTLTKNSPLKATDSHITILGHITRSELRRLLATTDAENGFANRFLWVMVRRSKELPYGGEWHTVNTAPLLRGLSSAIGYAKHAGEITWGQSARPAWSAVYGPLSEGSVGLFGAVTSRAEAHALRLACVYAVLDHSATIEAPHLHAALALWKYAEDSARFTFGRATGDGLADKIEDALAENPGEGLTRTEITHLFKRNKSASEISEALALLERLGRATCQVESTGGRGRPPERWLLKRKGHEQNEQNEETEGNWSLDSLTSFFSYPQSINRDSQYMSTPYEKNEVNEDYIPSSTTTNELNELNEESLPFEQDEGERF